MTTTKRLIFNNKFISHVLILSMIFIMAKDAKADMSDISRLKTAYPDHIQSVNEANIIWRDGTPMPVCDNNLNKSQQEKLDNPCLLDQVNNIHYKTGISKNNPESDPGRIRYQPFFQKMYGNTKSAVESKLSVIYWMPLYFGEKYPLLVTTVNDVDKKLFQISSELEILVGSHPEYLVYLDNPGGTFMWRTIANTDRLSAHSYGMTIDINSNFSDYWQWDLIKEGRPVAENQQLEYRNQVPWEIIPVFEKYGFIWGGKWVHYDSMHFEYRPEIM